MRTERTQGFCHKGNTTKKRRGAASTTGKTNPHEQREKELKEEEDERAQRRLFYWKKRQQQKLKKNTEVLDVSEFLRKKVQRGTRNKKERINTKKQIPNKDLKTLLEQHSSLKRRNQAYFA